MIQKQEIIDLVDQFLLATDSESFLIGIRNNLKSNKLVEALAICKDTQTPIASVCESILSRWSKDEMALHCAAEEAALIEIPRIQRYRRLIAAIGQLAPMLGFDQHRPDCHHLPRARIRA